MRRSQPSHCVVGAPFQSEVTAAAAYHPEFGYLCPSPLMRQRVRAVMISAGVGMLIGAGLVLSLVDGRFAGGQRSEQTLTVEKTDRDWTAIAKAADSDNQASLAAGRDSTSTPMPIMQGSCKDDGFSFLSPKCRLVKARKGHASRPTAARLATIEIGRIPAATEIDRPASAGMNGKSTQTAGGPSKPPEKSPRPSTMALEGAAVPPAKLTRHARIRERSREPKIDGINAFAYAQYYDHGGMYRNGREASKGNWGWSR